MKYILFLAYFLCMISNVFAGARKPVQRLTREQLAKRAALTRRLMPSRTTRPALPSRTPTGTLPRRIQRPILREPEQQVQRVRPLPAQRTRRTPKARERKRVFAGRQKPREDIQKSGADAKEVSRPEEFRGTIRRQDTPKELRQLLEKRVKARRAVIETPEYKEEVFMDEEEEIPPPLPEIPEPRSPLKKTSYQVMREEEEFLFEQLEEFEKEVLLNPYDIQLKILLEKYGRIIRQFWEKPNSELITLKMPKEWAFNLEPIAVMLDSFNYAAQIATQPEHIEEVKQIWLDFLKKDSKRLNVSIGF